MLFLDENSQDPQNPQFVEETEYCRTVWAVFWEAFSHGFIPFFGGRSRHPGRLPFLSVEEMRNLSVEELNETLEARDVEARRRHRYAMWGLNAGTASCLFCIIAGAIFGYFGYIRAFATMMCLMVFPPLCALVNRISNKL